LRIAPALAVAVVAVLLVSACGGSSTAQSAGVKGAQVATGDWSRFGYDAARHNVSPDTTITAADIGRLIKQQVQLDGTVDSSPIYVAAGVRGHDAFIVTTTYGRTEALDASTGDVLWRFTPPTYRKVAGTSQITTATPVLSTDRTAVYAAAPDGVIRKLRLRNGSVVWARSITKDPTHEKVASALNLANGRVIATTGGYIGDAPPYQGHVVTIAEKTGKIIHVWNSLCSDRHTLIKPSTCKSSDSAIWSRNGAAVDPATGDLVVATGNGPFDGKTDWGDSTLVLAPDASRLLRHWTPKGHEHLNDSDLDLGSTSPGLLANGYAIQGGKDRKMRLLNLRRLQGPNARTGGELQTVGTPGDQMMFPPPAIWQGTWAFVTTDGGTAAWRLRNGKLHPVWSNGTGGSSAVIAGSLLYIASYGSLKVYEPATGKLVASLPTGPLHWQSPIVAAGRIALAEGNANDHATSGVLDIFRLPG
jgi:outer membrane protein assembly factor BamB